MNKLCLLPGTTNSFIFWHHRSDLLLMCRMLGAVECVQFCERNKSTYILKIFANDSSVFNISEAVA